MLLLPRYTMMPNLCGLCLHFGFLDPVNSARLQPERLIVDTSVGRNALQTVLAYRRTEVEWTKAPPTLGVALHSSNRAETSANGLGSVLMPYLGRSDAKIVRRAASW
jgi:hypothetical protein